MNILFTVEGGQYWIDHIFYMLCMLLLLIVVVFVVEWYYWILTILKFSPHSLEPSFHPLSYFIQLPSKTHFIILLKDLLPQPIIGLTYVWFTTTDMFSVFQQFFIILLMHLFSLNVRSYGNHSPLKELVSNSKFHADENSGFRN